jgi:hypothetical protein
MAAKQCVTRERLLEELRRSHGEVVVTLGAGDIDRLVPVVESLLNERDRS